MSVALQWLVACMTGFIAQTFEELPSTEEILSMSGLDFMQAVLEGSISGPPIGKLMNYWLDSVSLGEVRFRGPPNPTNNSSICQ